MPTLKDWILVSVGKGDMIKVRWIVNYAKENTASYDLRISNYLTNSMAYGTRRFNAAFTRALQ